MALGLDSMQRAICPPNKPGLCPEMLPVNGSTLLAHLMNVSFSFLDEEVYFDEQGDPPGKYEILNFQRRRPSHLETHLENGMESTESEVHHGDSTAASNYQDPSRPLLGSDYSIASVAGNISASRMAEKKRLNPLYDSYSTLRVYRPHSIGSSQPQPTEADLGSTGLELRARSRLERRVRSKRQIKEEQTHLPASGYSSTSGYEYVHVGSWKSSDGLSLFGQIQWPRWRGSNFEAQSPGFNEFNLGGGVTSVPLDTGGWPQKPVAQQQAGHLPKSVCSLPCAKGHAKVSTTVRHHFP